MLPMLSPEQITAFATLGDETAPPHPATISAGDVANLQAAQDSKPCFPSNSKNTPTQLAKVLPESSSTTSGNYINVARVHTNANNPATLPPTATSRYTQIGHRNEPWNAIKEVKETAGETIVNSAEQTEVDHMSNGYIITNCAQEA
ncbi:hypothetical protein BT63DRAFT_159763 [Microthyrium microscopicum]|uniref:Uncharacterized protein n=1 Tax=Microthyrium microscopicum TaxID=703497 RepID=A0A6A6URJ4_9PEZI|nr:hypothetical protein BT63DRAFT_159763 [Microthyrium microscopicum]